MQRIQDTLYNVLDRYTGEPVTYNKVITYQDGTPMDDSKTDGIIYRKLGTEYFKRNYDILNVQWFGASSSNSNNLDAFTKAVKYGNKIYIPEETYTITGTVVVPQGVEIFGNRNKSIINFIGAGSGFQLDSKTIMYNLGFTGTPNNTVSIVGSDAKNKIIVCNCDFTSGVIGVYIDRGVNVTCYNIKVFGNTFTNMSSHGILSVRVNDSEFNNNFFRGSTGRNIEFFGGKRNLIDSNNIDGGITGIAFTCQYTTAQRFGQVDGNTISNNTITGVSEESISFDVRGNDPTNMATREQSFVTAKSTGINNTFFISLNNASLFSSFKPWIGLHLCLFDGKLKGNTVEISDYVVDGTSTKFTVKTTLEQYNLITINDIAIVGSPFTRNKIVNNTIITPEVAVGAIHPTTGIYLYGLCYYNSIISNNIRSLSATSDKIGIRVSSLAGLDATGSIITLPAGRKAPSENNIIDGNTLINCDEVTDCFRYGGVAAYPSIGNKHVNAKVQGKIVVESNQDLVSNSQALFGITYTNSTPNPIEGILKVIASGNNTTTINIPHNLGVIPTRVSAQGNNALSGAIDYVDADSTYIIIHHSTLRPTGSNDLAYTLGYIV